MTWSTKKLREVCEILIGGTPRRGIDKYWKNGTFPWVSIADLTRGGRNISETKEKITQAGVDESNVKVLPKGTLLFSFKLSIGKLAFAEMDLYTNEAIAGLIIKNVDELDKIFLYYYLQQVSFDTAQKAVKGKTLNKEKIKNLEILLPSLEEQRKIVRKIDELFGKIDEAQKLREEAQKDSAVLIPSALHQIFSQWKEKGWKEAELNKICDLQNGFAFESKDYITHSNTLNIRMSNIRVGGHFDPQHNIKYLPDSYANRYQAFLLKKGDLIIAMTDMASDPKILGVPTIVEDTNDKNYLLNQRVGRLYNFSEKIYVPYLCYVLKSEAAQGHFKSKGGGGLQINISKKDILSVNILIPSLSEQKKIVEYLDSLSEKVRELQKVQAETAADFSALRASILHTAFQGELL